jgi:hypothetical protein
MKLSRRQALQAAVAVPLLSIGARQPASANPFLLAIIPALITGMFSLLAANVQARERARNEAKGYEESLKQARIELATFDRRRLQKEYEDREKQGRDALVLAWIKAGVDAGIIDYKVAFEVARQRLLTTSVARSVGIGNVNLGFEDGFVKVAVGQKESYMHGGELGVARDWLEKTGRMPVPLDTPLILTNSRQATVRNEIARAFRTSPKEFDSKYAIFGSRPYSIGTNRTDYWLHSVVDTDLYAANQRQQIGFIETIG